jgi:hypothetical protein
MPRFNRGLPRGALIIVLPLRDLILVGLQNPQFASYSFVVKSGTVLYEVGVDAQTGKVLENSKEGPNPD